MANLSMLRRQFTHNSFFCNLCQNCCRILPMYEFYSKPSWQPTGRIPFVTYLLCLSCGAMFLWQLLGGQGGSSLEYPGYVDGVILFQGSYWGLLSSFFLHADFLHVAFNVYWLFRLGTVLESYIGWSRFFLFWLAGTACSSALEVYATGTTGIGASGFVYAVFGLIWIGGKGDEFLARMIDQQVIVLFIIWFFLCVALTWTGTWTVANGAHLGGFFFGAACAYACFIRNDPWLKRALAPATALALLPLFYAPWLSTWNLAQGTSYYNRAKYEQALPYLTRVHLPEYAEFTAETQADALSKLGRDVEATATYKSLLESTSELSNPGYIYNEYAWLLATSPDDKARNPGEAIRYAQMACTGDSYKNSADLDTLAAAYASNDQFNEAVKWQQQAISVNSDTNDLGDLQAHLKLYQAHQPYREPVAPSSSSMPRN